MNTTKIIETIQEALYDTGPVGNGARKKLTEKELNTLRGYSMSENILKDSLEGKDTPLQNIPMKFYEAISEMNYRYTSYRDSIDDYSEKAAEIWEYQNSKEYRQELARRRHEAEVAEFGAYC